MKLSIDTILWIVAICLLLLAVIFIPTREARSETIVIPSLVVGVQNVEMQSSLEIPKLSAILKPIERVDNDLSLTSIELVKRSV